MDTKIQTTWREAARIESYHKHGNCLLCHLGYQPRNGLHEDKHRCGNNDTCSICHNAGMENGDQCAACGRIEKS